MDKETVNRLAKLARIDLGEEEAGKLAGELGNILKYVSEVKEITSTKHQITNKSQAQKSEIRNTMREDVDAHESGVYTEDLLNSAPDREGDYVRVKKIL